MQWTHDNLHNICNIRKFPYFWSHEHFSTSLLHIQPFVKKAQIVQSNFQDQNVHNIYNHDISLLKHIIKRMPVRKEEVTFHDPKDGEDILRTNRIDLRYGAQKNLQWTHENWHNVRKTWKFSFLRPHEHFPTSVRYVMIANILHI